MNTIISKSYLYQKTKKNMCMWYECKPTETIKCIPMYRYDTVSKYANKNKDKN